MTVLAPSVAGLFEQIRDAGLDADGLFRAEGIEPRALQQGHSRYPSAAIDRIAARAAEKSGDPFFGLREADYFRPQQLGPLGFAWLASPTLRCAAARLERFARLVADHLAFESRDETGSFIITLGIDGRSEDPDGRYDGTMAVLWRMCQLIHPPGLVPERVRFVHAEPGDTSYYYALFQCPVDFGADANELVLPAAAADLALTGANEELARINDHLAVRYLATRDKEDVVNRVRTAILDGIADGRATEEAAAEQLHMSTRQLNRKLAERDTTFKVLLNEIRSELALQYIADPGLSLTEISFMLGFSEVSSFSRAFKRWTGRSPSKTRAEVCTP